MFSFEHDGYEIINPTCGIGGTVPACPSEYGFKQVITREGSAWHRELPRDLDVYLHKNHSHVLGDGEFTVDVYDEDGRKTSYTLEVGVLPDEDQPTAQPLPWKASPARHDGFWLIEILDAQDIPVGRVYGADPDARANLDLIVKAVNAWPTVSELLDSSDLIIKANKALPVVLELLQALDDLGFGDPTARTSGADTVDVVYPFYLQLKEAVQ